jgi:hypothetical protein
MYSSWWGLTKIQLIKNQGTGTETVVKEEEYYIHSTTIITYKGFTHTVASSEVVAGDTYSVFFDPDQILVGEPDVKLSTRFFQLTQIPIPQGNSMIDVGDPIWGYYSSSLDLSILSGSQANLNNNYGFLTQDPMEGSGFNSPYIKFTIEPGDEFRFEDDESKVFMVNDVIPPKDNPSGKIIVYLDKPVAASINKNYFLIRRYIPDGSFIIFESEKPSGESGPSFIKPEYITNKLKDNLGDYITDLKSKNLLT